MNAYPTAAEAVDSHLSSSIDSLRSSMETGFDRLERRMDNLVLKDTFQAEVLRLDQADKHLEEKLDGAFALLKTEMESGFADIEARDAKRDKQAEKRDEERDRKFARRMTWTISVVGLAFAVFQYVSATYF